MTRTFDTMQAATPEQLEQSARLANAAIQGAGIYHGDMRKATAVELARLLGTWPQQVLRWRKKRQYPTREYRRRLAIFAKLWQDRCLIVNDAQRRLSQLVEEADEQLRSDTMGKRKVHTL